MAARALLLSLAALPLSAVAQVGNPLTYYSLASLGVEGNSGWNACFLNNFLGSDTTVAVFNNAVWGGGKNSSGGATCAPSTGPVFYGPANLNVSNYFPNTPAPCPFATQPSSYNVTTAVYTGSPGTYSLAGVDGVTPVPHFLDFGSVLYKDVNGEIHRTAVPPGACLPGNLVNVRTSAVQYTAPSAAAAPVFPKNYLTYPTGANLIFTTANDDDTDAGGLQLFTPRDPVTGSIDVYFALNFGLRNALDNACDGTVHGVANCANGGYYISNLTTALLGDPSKGLGRAHTAVIRLCASPLSSVDRPWRKKSGDAVNNRQCQDVRQRLYGAPSEQPQSLVPAPAMTGIAVNGVPLVNYTSGSLGGPVIAAFVDPTNTTVFPGGKPLPSPVAFCRPKPSASGTFGFPWNASAGTYPYAADPSGSGSYASGYSPSKAGGANAWQWTNASDPNMAANCVMPGSSWAVTKGTNVNLNDPAWYKTTIYFQADTPKAVYFVRVFALDESGNFLGFGSSATSANLTNTAAQNYFKVDTWDAVYSSATVAAQNDDVYDIQAGAIGLSLMTVTGLVAFLLAELLQRRRSKVQDTEVVGAAVVAADADAAVLAK